MRGSIAIIAGCLLLCANCFAIGQTNAPVEAAAKALPAAAAQADIKPPSSPTTAAPDHVVGEPKPIDEWLAPESGWLETPAQYLSPLVDQVHDWVPDTWRDPKTWEPYEGSIEFGLNGQMGNSETFNSRFAANIKHKTPTLVRSLQLITMQRRARGRKVGDTTLLDGRLDFPMPESKWNRFAHVFIENDKFRAFSTRISADMGYGYEFFQSDPRTLIGRFGVSTSREVGGPDDEFKPELLFGTEYRRVFSNKSKFTFTSTYFPNVTDFNDYRINTQASCEVLLSKEMGLSLKSSAIHRYDSTPFGKKPSDLDYSTMFMWSF